MDDPEQEPEPDVDSYSMVCLTQENTLKNKHISFEFDGAKSKSETKVQFDLSSSDPIVKELRDSKYYVCYSCSETFEHKKKKPFKRKHEGIDLLFCSYNCSVKREKIKIETD